jgi:plastocyanin
MSKSTNRREVNMQRLTLAVGGVLVTLLQIGCMDSPSSTAPTRMARSAAASADARTSDHVVSMLDACDGPTFMAQQVDCANQHGVTFQQFIAELSAKGSVGAWHFAPSNLTLQMGQTFSAFNRGGETHTFTEVQHFGGGIVPALNQLSGNPTPAAECLALEPSDFIPPGGSSDSDTADEVGTELYQCCIHPWMRAMVTVKRG